MPHHSSFVMFENVTMVHPLSRAIVWHPCNLHLAQWFQVDRILPRNVFRRFTVYLEYLEEKSMQVERMVHQTCISYFPHLKLSSNNGFVLRMSLAVHKKIDSILKTWAYR